MGVLEMRSRWPNKQVVLWGVHLEVRNLVKLTAEMAEVCDCTIFLV